MVNLYPSRYHPSELVAHVIAVLERRRAAFEAWDDSTEQLLLEEAQRALAEAGQQFREVADDAPYWQRVTELVLQLGVARYLKLAREQSQLEQRGYDVWRRGDLLSRAAYALGGLAVGVLVLRTALPDWLEPLPLAFFIGGPLLPDVQIWFAKRRYAKQLAALVDDVAQESVERQAYQPLGIDEQVAGPSGVTEHPREKV